MGVRASQAKQTRQCHISFLPTIETESWKYFQVWKAHVSDHDSGNGDSAHHKPARHYTLTSNMLFEMNSNSKRIRGLPVPVDEFVFRVERGRPRKRTMISSKRGILTYGRTQRKKQNLNCKSPFKLNKNNLAELFLWIHIFTRTKDWEFLLAVYYIEFKLITHS